MLDGSVKRTMDFIVKHLSKYEYTDATDITGLTNNRKETVSSAIEYLLDANEIEVTDQPPANRNIDDPAIAWALHPDKRVFRLSDDFGLNTCPFTVLSKEFERKGCNEVSKSHS